MGRRRSVGPKVKKKKPVNVKLIGQKSGGQTSGPYRILKEIMQAHHSDLATNDCKIALAWQLDSKEDADGRIRIGAVKKRGDLEREFQDYDFVISINKMIWDSSSELQQKAMMDHFLCRCALSKDKNGEPKVNEENRIIYRTRRPEIQEFREVVARHGVYTNDLEAFVERAVEAQKSHRPLLDALEGKTPNTNGEAGVKNGQADELVPITRTATNKSKSAKAPARKKQPVKKGKKK